MASHGKDTYFLSLSLSLGNYVCIYVDVFPIDDDRNEQLKS